MKKTMLIADIKQELYVRQKLNDEHVLLLAGLYESGVKLPPVKVDENNRLNDGRHRIAARDILGLKDIDVEVLPIRDEVKFIATAFKSNVGGPLPPTTQDIEQTIAMLLERGETRKSIPKLLGLPTGLIRKLVGNVQSKMARKRLQAASSSVTEGGLTVAQASEQHKVDLPALREFMSVKRRKKRGVPELQRQVTSIFKSLAMKNSSLCKGLVEKFEDGDLTREEVREIFDHMAKANANAARTISDYRSRFDSLSKDGDTPAATAE